MSLTPFRVGQSNTPFTFSFSILILSSPITTPRNPTFLTFHLHFSGFPYKSFSTNLLTTSSINSLCLSSPSVPIVTSSMKLTTLPVLMRSHKISFIIVWNIVGEFINPKNITVGLNDLSSVVNTTFHLSPFFIHTLL